MNKTNNMIEFYHGEEEEVVEEYKYLYTTEHCNTDLYNTNC